MFPTFPASRNHRNRIPWQGVHRNRITRPMVDRNPSRSPNPRIPSVDLPLCLRHRLPGTGHHGKTRLPGLRR